MNGGWIQVHAQVPGALGQLFVIDLELVDAAGFRSALAIPNPKWMQAPEIEYYHSLFDTDSSEPVPGGTMSIWSIILGRLVRPPYTPMQDWTLATVLGETTPRLLLQKVDFIKRYRGMVLVTMHPDYLSEPVTMKV